MDKMSFYNTDFLLQYGIEKKVDPDEEEDEDDEEGFGSSSKKEEDDDPVMRKTIEIFIIAP
jgi:hypothetical protein